jgi:hypothetical protein
MARRFLVRSIVFCLIAAGIGAALQFLLVLGLRRYSTSSWGACNRLIRGEINAAVLVCGSSRALVHYDPAIISQQVGRPVFNIGRTGTSPDFQLAYLKTYLEHNRAPAAIIVNIDRTCFTTTKQVYVPRQYIPYLNETNLYFKLVALEPKFSRMRTVPLLGIVEERLTLTAVAGLLGMTGKEDEFDGYEPKDLLWTGEFEKFKAAHPTGEVVPVEDEGIKTFQEFLECCLCTKAKVLLVYSPEYYEAHALTQNRAEIMHHVREIAGAYRVEFWDYSDDPICRDKSLFYNSQHMNRRGATLFSQELAQRLKDFCSTNLLYGSAVAHAGANPIK